MLLLFIQYFHAFSSAKPSISNKHFRYIHTQYVTLLFTLERIIVYNILLLTTVVVCVLRTKFVLLCKNCFETDPIEFDPR